MESAEAFQRLLVALGAGTLIGIERGWHERDEPEGRRAAGLRTFALAGLLGGVIGIIAVEFRAAGALLLGLAFLSFSAVVAVYRWRETGRETTLGATTVVAAMLTFAIGALSAVGHIEIASAAAVAVAGLLALKPVLHHFVRNLTWPELRGGFVLAAMTFILLPLLPDRPVDPWGALNPHELWLMTIVLAAVSFAGYVAVKWTGAQRGVAISGFAGGLVASTAVTLDMARLSKQSPENASLFAAGALLAGSTMAIRVLLILAFFNVQMALWLAPALIAGAAVIGIFALWQLRRFEKDRAAPVLTLENPFELKSVLKFASLLVVITFMAKIIIVFGGATGTYLLAAASGLADVDAISLTMARTGASEIGLSQAAFAVAIAVGVNTLSKAVIAGLVGGRAFAGLMALPTIAALAGGGAGLAVAVLLF